MLELSFPLAGEAVPVHVPERSEDLDAFIAWFERENARGPLALDTETTGLDIFRSGFRLRTAQFGTAREAWVIPYELGGEFAESTHWALRTGRQFLVHNLPFDALVIDAHTPVPMGELFQKTIDTQVLAKLIDPRGPEDGGIGAGLKPLGAYWIDPSAPDTQAGLVKVFRSHGLTKATGWAGIPLWDRTYLSYAGGDVILGARLYPKLTAELERRGVRRELSQYEHELLYITAHMTRTGLLLDSDYVSGLDDRLHAEEDKWLRVAARYGVTSVNSGAQVSEALLGMGVELTARTDAGAWVVDKNVINPLAGLDLKGEPIGDVPVNPLAEAVFHAKRAHKWQSSYVQKFRDGMDANGLIHPFINTLQARTARMSITGDLAAQTLPSSDWMIRRAIVGEPDERFFSVDFKAIELRVLAALADVRRMKEAIAAGRDLHDFTAELIYGPGFTPKHRKTSKGVGLGKVYGGGADTLARQTGAPLADVKHCLSVYDRIYPEIGRAGRRWQREARANGLMSVSVTGRILPVDAHRLYTVTNYQCQSAARDVLGQALINMREAGLLPYLRLPIHDEVVGVAKRSEVEDVVREVERCMTMSLGGVPIDAEGEIGGQSWGSLYFSKEERARVAAGEHVPYYL
jgi:DNA polymerase-1